MGSKTSYLSIVVLVISVILGFSACTTPKVTTPPEIKPPVPVQIPTPPANPVPEPTAQPPSDAAAEPLSYVYEPGWWRLPQTYGMFNYWNDTDLQRLENTGSSVNGYRLIFDLDLINPNFDIPADIQRVHATGRKYIVGIAFNGIIEKWPEETSVLISAGALGLTYEGTPALQQAGENVCYFSTNHPAWQTALVEQGKRIVEAGADGITIIEPWGASFYPGFGGQPDFSAVSLAGFGEYLVGKYSIAELSAQGIESPQTFDYREYLQARGVTTQELREAPFYADYRAYQRQRSAEFFRRYVSEIKAHAREIGVPDFPVATAQHGGWLTPFTLELLSNSDFAFGNLDFVELGNVYDSHAFQYKLHLAATNGPLIAAPMDMSLGWLVQHSTQPDAWLAVKAAEAYVNRGGFHDTRHAGLTENGPLEYSANPEAVSGIFDFVTTNRELLANQTRSAARIAVLLALEAAQDDESVHWGTFVGTCRVLTTANLQYDVVLNRLPAAGSELIGRYDMVIVPGCQSLSPGTLAWLSGYRSAGGKLLTINQSPAEFSATPGPGLVHLDWHPEIQQKSLGNQAFLDIVGASPSVELFTERLPDGVLAQVWRIEAGTVLHLLNYDFDTANGMREKVGFTVAFKPGLAAAPTSVTLRSPELPGSQPINFNWDSTIVHFEIPSLQVWNIIVIQ